MNITETYKIVEKLESSIESSKFKLFGIDIWPYMRLQLVLQLNAENRPESKNDTFHWKRIWKKAISLPLGIYHLIFFSFNDNVNDDFPNSKRDVVFLTDSISRRLKTDRGWYDVHVDPIIDYYEKLNKTYFVFESSSKFVFKSPRYRKSSILTLKMIIAYLQAILKYPFIKVDPEFERIFKKYNSFFKDVNLQELAMNKYILRLELLYVHQLSKYFIKHLLLLQPKIAFVVSYYGYKGMALCYACNKLKIVIADIQHGSQGQFHPAYGSFFSIPKDGYNTLPNVFLNWRQKDSDNINSWAHSCLSIKAYNIGNPTLESFLGKSNITKYYDEKINKYYGISRKKILITLQGKYIPDIFIDAINGCSNEYLYLIRLHPDTSITDKRDIINKLNHVLNKPYEIDFVSTLPIYAILRNVNLHITQNSGVVVEASLFNVKSIITDGLGVNYYRDYIFNGSAVYCDKASEFPNIVDELIDKKCEKLMTPLLKNENLELVLNSLVGNKF
jgi:hypothetical protein